MSVRMKIIAGAIAAAVVVALALAARIVLFRRPMPVTPVAVEGAVVLDSPDPAQQAPLAGVRVTAATAGSAVATSDTRGFFSLRLPAAIKRGDTVEVLFSRSEYRPLQLSIVAGEQLAVARMTPLAPRPAVEPVRRRVTVTNVRMRYSIAERRVVNVGTGVKMFETPNRGNVPCRGRHPCSPDGRWKAGIGGASLDAGPDNTFQNARVSCLAGPCPFTKIEEDRFSAGGRRIGVTVRDWSDTATFVLQAEVVREEISDVVRYVYPVVLDRTVDFTLPASAEGPSIEAEIDGVPIVFPLGPRPDLSWAACEVDAQKAQSKVYRCELKPGYRIQ